MIGVLNALYGVAQIALVAIQNALLKAALPNTAGDPTSERWRIVSALLLWCIALGGIAGANYGLWMRVRPPTMGSVTMAQVREHAPLAP